MLRYEKVGFWRLLNSATFGSEFTQQNQFFKPFNL